MLSGRDAKPSADVYALGKVLVFMLTGGTDIDFVRFREWRVLIRQCTAEQEGARPSLAQIMVSLEEINE